MLFEVFKLRRPCSALVTFHVRCSLFAASSLCVFFLFVLFCSSKQTSSPSREAPAACCLFCGLNSQGTKCCSWLGPVIGPRYLLKCVLLRQNQAGEILVRLLCVKTTINIDGSPVKRANTPQIIEISESVSL